uniref:Uncharacterized protein n=1 Tax=Arundo donax TaxID=35708 RepID=A0A0A9HGW6_ARUDO
MSPLLQLNVIEPTKGRYLIFWQVISHGFS